MEHLEIYPILYQHALTLLAVQAQSLEAVRVFSTMNQLVSNDRASLSAESCKRDVLSFRWRELFPWSLNVNTINAGTQVDLTELDVVVD